MAAQMSYARIRFFLLQPSAMDTVGQRLSRHTQKGSLPGEVHESDVSFTSALPCQARSVEDTMDASNVHSWAPVLDIA